MENKPIYPTYSTNEVFESTYNLTKEVKLSGAIVECGVAAGSNFAQMIKASMDSGIDRHYWGFDSFQGIPWAKEVDGQQPGIGTLNMDKLGVLESSGITVHNLNGVRENLRQWGVLNEERVHLVEGWFQNTLPTNTVGEIAVLRLDGDLYESTKICLEYLYPKVQKGGLIIIDDWELAGCNKAVKDYIKGKRVKLIKNHYTVHWYK